MRKTIVVSIIILLFSEFCYTQTDSLPKQKFNYPNEINLENPYEVSLKKSYTIYSNPKLENKAKIKVVQANKDLKLIDHILIKDIVEDPLDIISYNTNEVVLVKYKNIKGYINPYENRTISNTEEEILNWIIACKAKYFKNKRIKRKKYLINKYGDSTGVKLLNLKFERGMSKEMILDAMGKPDKINTTDGVYGKQEQIIYRNFRNLNENYGYGISGGPIYLYFENEKLKTIQH